MKIHRKIIDARRLLVKEGVGRLGGGDKSLYCDSLTEESINVLIKVSDEYFNQTLTTRQGRTVILGVLNSEKGLEEFPLKIVFIAERTNTYFYTR